MSDGVFRSHARRFAITVLVMLLLTSIFGAAAARLSPAAANQPEQSALRGPCGVLDALCDTADGLTEVADGVGIPDPGDLLGGAVAGLSGVANPFAAIGDTVAKGAADAWTAAMLAIWNSGLFVLRIVLTFSELFLTPDLQADGPGRDLYATTLWLALVLVVILVLVQLGAAAFKREGKGLARAVIGAGQFVLVCACWFGYCAGIIVASGALTRALMDSLLGVQTWPEWDPLGGLDVDDITDAGVATALAFLGLFLWLAAIGHFLVYLARAASLLVLTASAPLSAAGLVSEFTRSWFWKSLRWFHAAAFTPVLMAMVLGIGVQFSSGVAADLTDDTAKAFGTALPAVMTILISVVSPLALFKLLAFVDPGTPSGASFRQGMAIQGGLQGLLSGRPTAGGSDAASATDANGRSSGEQSAETSTDARFSSAARGLAGSLGQIGQAVSSGIGWINSAGAKATSLMSDESNQAGVGQSTYGPDFSGLGRQQPQARPHGRSHDGDDTSPREGPDDDRPSPPTSATLPSGVGLPPRPGVGQGSGATDDGSPKSSGGSGGAAGGAGEAVGGVPPVV